LEKLNFIFWASLQVNLQHPKDLLGSILSQLPPNWHKSPERLEGFLKAAPKRSSLDFGDA